MQRRSSIWKCRPSEPYAVAEWKDETTWADCGIRLLPQHQGLLLAAFPLEFVPGDHAEVAALEFAKAQVASSQPLDEEKETDKLQSPGDLDFLRLRLRWASGLETEAPEPRYLFSSSTQGLDGYGAVSLCPCVLLGFCCCLAGLLLDVLLLAVRKRFYTLQGTSRVGSLTFTCSSDGQVAVNGQPSKL
ncbi:unnamed protein product, partial [Polarella glacialis]